MEPEYRPFPNEAGRDTRQATIKIPLMGGPWGCRPAGECSRSAVGVAWRCRARPAAAPVASRGARHRARVFRRGWSTAGGSGRRGGAGAGRCATDAIFTRLVRSRGGLRDLLPHRPAGGGAGGDRPGARGWRPVHPRDAGEPAPEPPGPRVRAAIAVEGFRLLRATSHRRPVERAAPARVTRPNRQLCVVTAL